MHKPQVKREAPTKSVPCSGWVEGVCFSASGNSLVFTAHDSSVHFVTFGSDQPIMQTIRFRCESNKSFFCASYVSFYCSA
jgi:hypothetical protein